MFTRTRHQCPHFWPSSETQGKNKGVGGPAKLDKVSERLQPCHQCPHLSLHPELAPELELRRA